MRILKVSPNFRVIATGVFPTEKNDYITAEIASIFAFHVVPDLPSSEVIQLLQAVSPDTPVSVLKDISEFAKKFNQHKEFRQTPFTLRHSIRYRLSSFSKLTR